MQHLEVSGAVQHIYTSFGSQGLKSKHVARGDVTSYLLIITKVDGV